MTEGTDVELSNMGRKLYGRIEALVDVVCYCYNTEISSARRIAFYVEQMYLTGWIYYSRQLQRVCVEKWARVVVGSVIA